MVFATALHAEIPEGYKDRQTYQKAIALLRAGQLGRFRQLKIELNDYPLRPYLDYHYLRARLTSANTEAITSFTAANPDIPAVKILHYRWLKQLGKTRKWQTLRDHYAGDGDAELHCYYLRALYGTGQKEEALAKTAAAWNKPQSQPKACDPLFTAWQASDYFKSNIVWQRLKLALQENEVSLSRYLLRFFSSESPDGMPSPKATAEAFYRTHVNPARIARTSTYKHRTVRHKTIIAHALSRLAQKSPTKAGEAWRDYRNWDFWSSAERAALELEIAISLAKEGAFPDDNTRVLLQDTARFSELATHAVNNQNWSEVMYWIDRLPIDVRKDSRWQYWLARALEQTTPGSQRAHLAYQALANDRHYYGFLAAHRLGIPGTMNAVEHPVNMLAVERLKKLPPFARSIELFAVGDQLNARREWLNQLPRISRQEQILAAELARGYGLLPLAIATANEAGARDYLHLRFPIGFEPQFRNAAMRTGLPAATLVALARQESALNHEARSQADAHGLMQLLPSTARMIAKRTRRSFTDNTSLYDPGTNINLGSAHLAWLISRYNGQTPLAFAAYNAGERRVDQWVKDATGMPIDIWIERIPFGETRNYVKNVLAFRHVYAERLGLILPFLSADETTIRGKNR